MALKERLWTGEQVPQVLIQALPPECLAKSCLEAVRDETEGGSAAFQLGTFSATEFGNALFYSFI